VFVDGGSRGVASGNTGSAGATSDTPGGGSAIAKAIFAASGEMPTELPLPCGGLV